MKSVVSEKGQVTIPKRLRDRLGISAGQILDFEEVQGALVARKITPEDSINAVYGILDEQRSTDELIVELRGEAGAT